MSNFIFFGSGDLHLDYFRQFSKVYPDGTTSRLHIIKEVIMEGIKKASCDTIILCGDIINRAKNIDPILANFVKQMFEEMSINKEVIVFPGNHSLRMSFGQVHSMLKPILPKSVTYIEHPTTLIKEDFALHICPFYPNIAKLKQDIDDFKLKHDKVNLFFSHFALDKAVIRDDFSMGSKYGYIKADDLKKFDYSFMSDIHKSQEIDGHILYFGSPVAHSFNEEGDPKFTWKIIVTPSQIEKIKYPSNAPVFKTVVIEKDDDIQQLANLDKSKYYIRVISKIPSITTKIDTSQMVLIEQPEEIKFESNMDSKSLVREFVKNRNLELIGLLGKYL